MTGASTDTNSAAAETPKLMMSLTANERESTLDDLNAPQIDAPLKM